MSHTDIFARVRQHPGMWLSSPSFDVMAAFVEGYDVACEGGVLCGFREWLVLRRGEGQNLTWTALVLECAFPEGPSYVDSTHYSQEDQQRAWNLMFDLIAEFDTVRKADRGPGKIFAEYAKRFGGRVDPRKHS